MCIIYITGVNIVKNNIVIFRNIIECRYFSKIKFEKYFKIYLFNLIFRRILIFFFYLLPHDFGDMNQLSSHSIHHLLSDL
jgi:hypothetical protein